MKEVGIGVIGAGAFGEIHSMVYSELPDAKLVAVADVNAERAREVASRYKAERWYGDWAPLLERKDIDAVSVVTPEGEHRDPAVEAAKAGKHVLVEKPIATSLEDADAMIKAAERNGTKLMVGHILRFAPGYVQIKQAIDSGSLGEPVWAYSRRNGSLAQVKRIGGRVSAIMFLGIHDIDLLLWYVGGEVERVYCESVSKEVGRSFGVPDFSWILMKFKNGALGSVETGWGLPEKWADWKSPSDWGAFAADIEVEVVGTKGAAYLDFPPMMVTGCDGEGFKFPDLIHRPRIHGKTEGAIKLELQHFIDCVKEGKPPLVDGKDGRRALEVALAAEASSASRKPAKLPLA
ncbi:MAG: Gfo/Idh/MocA family oxidoreductase [Candidatus Brockarchaeota archaeon]|nr:Gfo/Idh/MocA family oxidoreductase [Candidatus Brockarchaeota archaeon]